MVERDNRNVLSRCLKTASDGANATWRGRSFHTVTPETGNARLPTVERRTGGTSRRCEAEDRSRRLDVIYVSIVPVKSNWKDDDWTLLTSAIQGTAVMTVEWRKLHMSTRYNNALKPLIARTACADAWYLNIFTETRCKLTNNHTLHTSALLRLRLFYAGKTPIP